MAESRESSQAEADSVVQVMRAAAKPRCMEVTLCGGLYGLDVEHIKEIVALGPLSRVFHAPPAIAGIVNLRGEVLTVIDVSVLLAGTPSARGPTARIVALRDGGGERRVVGLLVDRLGALRQLEARLSPPPSTLSPRSARLVRGVLSEPPPCSVLDIQALFQTPELLELGAGDVRP